MRQIKKIYVHHSASRRVKTKTWMIKKWHVEDNGWSDIGYHYVIEGEGQVVLGRPVGIAGAHVKGDNKHTIGICVVGNFEREEPHEKQLEALDLLLRGLMAVYELERKDIYVHREHSRASTDCPGTNLLAYVDEWRNNEEGQNS